MFDKEFQKKVMSVALNQANLAEEKGEVPVGAVMLYENDIVAKAGNSLIACNDPTAHAEINVIRKTAELKGNYRLNSCSLFVTLEPCIMCYSAIVQARLKGVYFGAFDIKTGVFSTDSFERIKHVFNHTPYVEGGIMEDDCSVILKNFFIEKRKRSK